MAVKSSASDSITVVEIQTSTVSARILGTTPMIMNAMPVKAKRELILPKGRKTTADRAQGLKHEPFTEYRNSTYRTNKDDAPTRLLFPAPGLKGAMMTAALDLPGTKKSEIGRLCWVKGYQLSVWGKPQIFTTTVRSADINRTPDMRTRAILPEWCMELTVEYVMPKLSATAIVNLLAAGGLTCGIGDFRQEKGKGNFGQFVLVGSDNADFQRIQAEGGRDVQDEALESPAFFDGETEDLLLWFEEEVVRMGKRAA